MNEPFKMKTAMAPQPVSRDEVRLYFERLAQRRAVNPGRENGRIMKR